MLKIRYLIPPIYKNSMKKILLTTLLLLCVIFVGFAHVNTYDVADQGYLRKPMEAKNGLVLTNNRYSENETLV